MNNALLFCTECGESFSREQVGQNDRGFEVCPICNEPLNVFEDDDEEDDDEKDLFSD